MKIGVCTGIENAKILAENGYDYLELGLRQYAIMDDSNFNSELERIKQCSMEVYAFNLFLPKGMKIVGDGIDDKKIENYLHSALARASKIGAKIVVFGSGKARNVPEKFDKKRAYNQLVKFLNTTSHIAKQKGITIVIEPLRRQETNIINTAEEGLELVKEINHPSIRLLIDYFHMVHEKESFDIISEVGNEYLKHLHISNPFGRKWISNINEANYKKFFSYLNKINYNGGISLEVGVTNNLKQESLDTIKCLTELL